MRISLESSFGFVGRGAVARAHAQSLINAVLTFATGELTSGTDFANPPPR
jgi:hypothetical protein